MRPTTQLQSAVWGAGLTVPELWTRYFSLGGTASLPDVRAHVDGAPLLDVHQNDVLVHALNEAFEEQGLNHPIPYSDDPELAR